MLLVSFYIPWKYQKTRGMYPNLPRSTIVRLSHHQSEDTQGQKTILAPSADKQTLNYDTECSNHPPSQLP